MKDERGAENRRVFMGLQFQRYLALFFFIKRRNTRNALFDSESTHELKPARKELLT